MVCKLFDWSAQQALEEQQMVGVIWWPTSLEVHMRDLLKAFDSMSGKNGKSKVIPSF